MAEIFTEVGVKYAITRWKEKFGTQPDINSPEFKAFQKQVNRDYNYQQQTKADNDKNIDSYVDTLTQILQQKPQSFPQEFYNALTNLQKKGKVELCNKMLQTGIVSGESQTWIQIIGNLYNSNKNESAEVTLKAMMESSKYPWISGLVNQRLFKEDDFNLDNFDASVAGAGGMNTTSDTTSTDTSSTDNTTTQDNNGDFNLDDFASENNDLHISPAGGAVDSISGGMDMGVEDDPMAGVNPDAPVYRVIDVMFDEKDPEVAPRVKVQNVETGETEIRDIFDLDV